jgi:putative transposase
MGYPPRFEGPGTFHIASHAVGREPLCRDEEDFRGLLWLLARQLLRRRLVCLAYCLMGTHLHVLVTTAEPGLSDAMRDVLATYARRYNRRYDRRGHLLERRFRSKALTDERHLYATLRYIALNPVRAGICARPEEWPWSSFAATAGLAPRPAFLAVDETLRLFGGDVAAYRALVEHRLGGTRPVL